MRTPSNRILPLPNKKMGMYGYLIILLMLISIVGLVLSTYDKPLIWAIIGCIGVFSWISFVRMKRRLGLLAAERQNEDICKFAKSFDYRNLDTWIIRATYEELQGYLKIATDKFPIRATDRLKEDLNLDPEDLDDIAHNIAERAKYDMSETKNNPLYDKVNTVADMVLFFSYQPKLKNTEQIAQPDSQ